MTENAQLQKNPETRRPMATNVPAHPSARILDRYADNALGSQRKRTVSKHVMTARNAGSTSKNNAPLAEDSGTLSVALSRNSICPNRTPGRSVSADCRHKL